MILLKNIYMAQPNSQYGNSVYFPYASGSLIAYAFENTEVQAAYRFADFFYKKEDIDTVVSRLDDPFLIGFSCYVWNYEYNKALAAAVKKAYPQCVTVFGGHQVNADTALEPTADYVLVSEGEESFLRLLLYLAGKEELENIPNLVYKKDGAVCRTACTDGAITERVSPYLKGYFDRMLEQEELEFSAVLETNRGCPNKCAFCDWGNIKTQMRNFDLATVQAEIDWMGEKKIEYCYCADGNFGLMERDEAITEYLIRKHAETGYPQKFQATYSKNNPDAVFRINKRLNEAGMCKGATLSFQSMNPDVLANIFRKNMPLENFRRLMTLYGENKIAAYSEIILGLPGETYKSFRDGIEQLLEYGQHMSINFFCCELLTNSIMNTPEYKKQYAIEFARTQQHQYHVVPDDREIEEYSRIVVATSTMTRRQWIDCNILSVFVRAFHNLGLLQCIAIYLYYEKQVRYMDFYEALISWARTEKNSVCGRIYDWLCGKYGEVLRDAGSLTCVEPDFGALSWPLDEGAFLHVIREYETFCTEIRAFLRPFFAEEPQMLEALLQYQNAVLKTPFPKDEFLSAEYDFYKYFSDVYVNHYTPLQKKTVCLCMDASDIPHSFPEYARRVIWYGRKGGQNIITNIRYAENQV